MQRWLWFLSYCLVGIAVIGSVALLIRSVLI